MQHSRNVTDGMAVVDNLTGDKIHGTEDSAENDEADRRQGRQLGRL